MRSNTEILGKVKTWKIVTLIKTRKLFAAYICVFVVLAIWVGLLALNAPHIPPVPAPLWPLLYALLLISVPLALLRVAMWRFFGNTAPNEAIKMLLAAVSVAVVLYWVMQGYLAARLNVELSGEAYKMASQDRRLVVTSIRIANIGNSNTSIESAVLKVFPGGSEVACPSGQRATDDLKLAATPGDKNPAAVRIGLDSAYYTIVWGTDESRQIAVECPASDYYRLTLDLRARQAFLNTGQTWRATAVVPIVQSLGRSPELTRKDDKIPSIIDTVKAIPGPTQKSER